MTRVRWVVACALTLGLAGLALSAQGPGVRITYLYDNTVAVEGVKPDWGFACLIEGSGKRVLFDTGTRADVLRHNLAALKIDLAGIQALVFSHDHGDHTMGIDAVPATAGLPVYVGAHFRLAPAVVSALERIGAKRIPVSQPTLLFPGFNLTGEMLKDGIYEQGLVLDSPDGLIVVLGCAHPGVVAMLRQVSETTKRPIHMVVGGFHLLQTPADQVKQIVADFKALGVKWAGPTHCTGDEAIRLFREGFGDHFIQGGVGTVIEVPKAVTSPK